MWCQISILFTAKAPKNKLKNNFFDIFNCVQLYVHIRMQFCSATFIVDKMFVCYTFVIYGANDLESIYARMGEKANSHSRFI